MSNNGAFFSKTFYVSGFPAQKTFWYKKREIGVFMTCIFEHQVQGIPHFLPKGKSKWLNNHTPAYSRIICQSTLNYQVVIPLRIIFLTACNFFTHIQGNSNQT